MLRAEGWRGHSRIERRWGMWLAITIGRRYKVQWLRWISVRFLSLSIFSAEPPVSASQGCGPSGLAIHLKMNINCYLFLHIYQQRCCYIGHRHVSASLEPASACSECGAGEFVDVAVVGTLANGMGPEKSNQPTLICCQMQ